MGKTRSFPRAGIGAFYRPAGMSGPRRRRGVGDSSTNAIEAYGSLLVAPLGRDPVTGNFSFMAWPNAIYDAATGMIDSNQQAQILTADQVANLQAATNPITGAVNQQLLDTSNAQAAAGIGPASNVSNISTGSWLANVADSIQGTFTGAVGLPGSTPDLGTAVEPLPGGGTDWTSIIETLAISAAILVGGYLVIKNIA